MIDSPFAEYDFKGKASRVFQLLEGLPAMELYGHRSFVITLAEEGTTEDGAAAMAPIIHGEIGVCPPQKSLLFTFYSVRKLLQLLEHPDHISSQQSADEVPGRLPPKDRNYGGGIRFSHGGKNYLFSISGLPWKCDEAFCVVTAIAEGWIPIAEANSYAAASKNEVIGELLRACLDKGLIEAPKS